MDRVVIVTKPTRLEELVRKHLTLSAARFALESEERSIEPLLTEHDTFQRAYEVIRQQIPNDLQVASATRDELPHFQFRDGDLIVVCGPDGLFANLAKYVRDQKVLSVNPDSATVAGALMLFSPQAVGPQIARIRSGSERVERLPFVKAVVGDKILWGINDIFIGRRDHISARYELSFNDMTERQSSSGIIVSTGVGATGWLKSIVAMVEGLGAARHKLQYLPRPDDPQLVFVVREPFPSPGLGSSLVTGRITPDNPLIVVSEMAHGGALFSDGVIEKAIEWKAGVTAKITVGERYISRLVT